jgi:hypothetical protein
MQRRYWQEHVAREKAAKETPAAVESEPAAPFEEPSIPLIFIPPTDPNTTVKPTWPTGTTWWSRSGALNGTYLAAWELGEAIRDGKFEEGDILVHKARGEPWRC